MIVDVQDVKKLSEKTPPPPLNTDLQGQCLIRKPQATSSFPLAEALTISDAASFF